VPWPWRHSIRDIKADEAIAQLCFTVQEQVKESVGTNRPTLIIPNDLSLAQQQQIIDASRMCGGHVRLLWRPVAAGIAWCLHEHTSSYEQGAGDQDDRSLGHILALHVGLDDLEVVVLEIVSRRVDGRSWVLPARGRQRFPRFRSLGLSLLTELATRDLKSQGTNPSEADIWHLLWCSPWAHEAVSALSGRRGDAGSRLQEAWLEVYRTAGKNEDHGAEASGIAYPTPGGSKQLIDWLEEQREGINAMGVKLVGGVVTGPIGSMVFQGETVGSRLMRQLADVSGQVLVEGLDLPSGVLGQMAALFGSRQAAGLPTYRDTLPRLETLVMQLGEPVWAGLLTDADVDGGQEWQREENFGKGQLAIGAHEDALLLELHHEDFPTVRTFTAPLERQTGSKIPVSLAVSISPAQGNARVEVIPDDPNLWGRRRVLLNWKSMHDTGKTSEQRLDEHPRICPPVVVRPSSWARWRAARNVIDRIQTQWGGYTREDLQWLNRELQLPDPDREFHYAVSSDGESPRDQDMLECLVDELLALMQGGEVDLTEYCFRVLANTFTADERFQDILAEMVDDYWDYASYELLPIGRCMREPESVAEYCNALLRKLRDTHVGVNDWLRALSEVSKYREHALRDTNASVGRELTRHLLAIFNEQVAIGAGHYIFRHAIVSILYLLRIRRYDNGFMDPNSDLAESVKESCIHARDLARRGKLSLTGGQVNLAACLDEVIAYIDRRGRGIPILAKLE